MKELEECPYCGKVPLDEGGSGGIVWCTNGDCKNFGNRMPRKHWNTRPREDSLRDSLISLRKEIEDNKKLFDEIRNKRDTLQITLDTLRTEMQALVVSSTNMKERYENLEKELDECKKLEKQTKIAFEAKLKDEQKAYEYKLNSIQALLDIAEGTIKDILLSNTTLKAICLEQSKIANDGLKKIKNE